MWEVELFAGQITRTKLTVHQRPPPRRHPKPRNYAYAYGYGYSYGYGYGLSLRKANLMTPRLWFGKPE